MQLFVFRWDWLLRTGPWRGVTRLSMLRARAAWSAPPPACVLTRFSLHENIYFCATIPISGDSRPDSGAIPAAVIAAGLAAARLLRRVRANGERQRSVLWAAPRRRRHANARRKTSIRLNVEAVPDSADKSGSLPSGQRSARSCFHYGCKFT